MEGRRAVRELLAAGRRPVRRLWLAEGLDPSPQLDEIEALAVRRHVRVETVPRSRLEAEARTDAPQGVLAVARPIEAVPLETLCERGRAGPIPSCWWSSGVTDPRNLGALLRSAECAGVTGVVLPRHRAAHLSPTVAKVAAGAIEHLSFALVGGVPAALQVMPTTGCGASAWPARPTGPSTSCPSATGRWPWWWAARRGAWPRWSAGAATRWWPSPSTGRCPR